MKEALLSFLREAQNDLDQMKKDKMSLTDRINYERALVRMEAIRSLLNRFKIE